MKNTVEVEISRNNFKKNATEENGYIHFRCFSTKVLVSCFSKCICGFVSSFYMFKMYLHLRKFNLQCKYQTCSGIVKSRKKFFLVIKCTAIYNTKLTEQHLSTTTSQFWYLEKCFSQHCVPSPRRCR